MNFTSSPIDGGAHKRTPEYDVARIARERDRPFAEIAARIEAWLPPQ